MAEKIGGTVAIKKYMERSDDLCAGAAGKPVSMSEFRDLSAEDRKALAEMCAAALGLELQA